MTATATPTRQSRLLPVAVLVTAVLQAVAPVVTLAGPGTSPGGGSGPDLLITPVGWAFSIWGVIYTLAIVQAVAALVTGATGSERRQVAQVVLYLGGTAWIALAGLDSSIATAAALTVMFGAALVAVLAVEQETFERSWLGTLTRAAVGLYAGWVTAAFFLNVSTALVDLGAFEAGDVTWQVVVLGVAVLVLLGVTAAVHGSVAYAAAGVWAMIGISVTAQEDGTGEVAGATLVGIVLLVVATIVLGLRRRKAPLPVL
ncbi:hypothetical protein [Aeromicrobium sp. Leaf350]|uniref:hypothetical protein n=1 Tax=Aeromicrobium sp. Leaf350 TaxID=2876565 RepID=UPI001E2F0FD5|nr:hypothetical protein [Aeromicrobium sp. Leaf350]